MFILGDCGIINLDYVVRIYIRAEDKSFDILAEDKEGIERFIEHCEDFESAKNKIEVIAEDIHAIKWYR